MAKPIRSLSNNLVEPLLFCEADAIKFSGRNVCAECEGTLQPKYVSYDRFNVTCLLCRKLILEGEWISKDDLPVLHQSRILGQREMRDEPKVKRTTEQAIKDLGF